MKNFLRNIAGIGLLLGLAIGGYVVVFNIGLLGEPPQPGRIEGQKIPEPVIANRKEQQRISAQSVGATTDKQILFGDLHAHTTYSTDAFLWSLPMNGGTGPHPIADACDFARYCSALDFWAITDHAESLTPRRWQETKDSMRTCQAISGDGDDPDMVSFTGFEWTQVGIIPEEHFGHKNVIFKKLNDQSVSARPIAAKGVTLQALRDNQVGFPPQVALVAGTDIKRYANFNAFVDEVSSIAMCDPLKPSSELPENCTEVAGSPVELVEKLENQGLDPMIIPHGTTWGFYTPSGTTWNKALRSAMKPQMYSLIEIYSGHGNAEDYRAVKTPIRKSVGDMEFVGDCVPPTGNFIPSCWQAGEIIRNRCKNEGLDKKVCEIRAAEARENYVHLGNAGYLSIPGVKPQDWLNSGQCDDCFQPAFNMRFGTSVQASLAVQGFDDNPAKPNRFVWGFIGSSDNHRARPGTGYKEYQRMLNTEAGGPSDPGWHDRVMGKAQEPVAKSNKLSTRELLKKVSLNLLEVERNGSFFSTGGLAAVHAEGRSREEIWAALQRRETYATSGPRILLWFNLLNSGENSDEKAPMGSEVKLTKAPKFLVKAVGAFKQAPGIPDTLLTGISKARLNKICGGEAYNPTSERHKITRIEIIRIRPQTQPDQEIGERIDDPFLVKKCDGSPRGCSFEFSDPDYVQNDTDAIYYARGIQEATPTVNAAALRCDYNAEGVCVKVNPCFGDYRTDSNDNCLAPQEHRAWSSPIYLRRHDG